MLLSHTSSHHCLLTRYSLPLSLSPFRIIILLFILIFFLCTTIDPKIFICKIVCLLNFRSLCTWIRPLCVNLSRLLLGKYFYSYSAPVHIHVGAFSEAVFFNCDGFSFLPVGVLFSLCSSQNV